MIVVEAQQHHKKKHYTQDNENIGTMCEHKEKNRPERCSRFSKKQKRPVINIFKKL